MVLQEMLRALCVDTGWCYAVFWKLKRRSRMVVTWEDGYCEAMKLNSAFNNLTWPTQDTPESIKGGIPVEKDGVCQQERIGLAVAKMSYQVYTLGEGIIGRVAFTGKHQWVLAAGDESNSSINAEANCGGSSLRLTIDKYPAEWQNQLAAGIKTIAVIGVLGGVVQLGSTHMIMENLEYVDHIRSMFGMLQGIPVAFPSDSVTNRQEKDGQSLGSALGKSTSNHQFQSTQTLKPDSLVIPPVGDRYSQNRIRFSKGCEIIQAAIPIAPNRDWKPEIPQTSPSGGQQIPLYVTGMECQEFLYPHQGRGLSYSDMHSDAQRKTYPDGSGQRSCQVNIQMTTKCNTNSFKLPLGCDQGNADANSTSSSDIYQPIVEEMIRGQVSPQDLGWDTAFVIGDELSQVLGPAFQRKSDGLFGEESKMESNIQPSGSGMVDKFVCNYGKEEEINKGCPYVLERTPDIAIRASAVMPSQGAADEFSCKSAMSGIESEMLVLSPARFKADNDLYSSECFQGKKSEESGKESRKRAHPGESGRPRPKDRQQIQDRVHELRDIIPNGSKCSIDSLLEKTIKHMLFLQSVSCHADVLKQNRDIKANTGNGTTATLEFCGHGTEHPIVVEYLKNPNQMLVEMLCEERGLFLEIADMIKGLGLTILKGVIESRPDNVWARFIVEKSRPWFSSQTTVPRNLAASRLSRAPVHSCI